MREPAPPYTVSPALLVRDDMRAALYAHDFAAAFLLMRKWDHASQDRIASPIDGFSQPRISRIVRGEERIQSLEVIEWIADGLRIPGAFLRLAPRSWEADTPAGAAHPQTIDPAEPETSPGRDVGTGGLVVEEDFAELRYDGGVYYPQQRRRITNVGSEPVTRYLMRISVDRYPGDPERSARLYRANPLRWDFLRLAARCDGEEMSWTVKTDWDALKEVWLLFENVRRRFPLYPGDTATIEYAYQVREDKWGQWFQRAVRTPTRHLSVSLDFPADLDPVVWGMETSTTADAFPFRTAIRREGTGDRRIFSWETHHPPLHTRYRLEWNFRTAAPVPNESMSPSSQMASVGIVQDDAEILRHPARLFDLPMEDEDARRVIAELVSAIARVAALHTFGKGMGIAAPQIGINRAAAIVRAPNGETVTLLNPRIVEESPDSDEQYEGCLSFFDVRGLVPRPLTIHVEHTDIDGTRHITVFDRGLARLVAHEIDHLCGHLYTDRMRPGVGPIPVEQYRGTGSAWTYNQ
ncbi:peptide deformylase [Frankia sp. Cas4]|uniref:peptide deformylase n=1 Tax=Frankia sp. Cas4 TaxID=3073927 RepID=UPI002AD26C7C|nr:peptide deformylase [Frankia sp. Cas4]